MSAHLPLSPSPLSPLPLSLIVGLGNPGSKYAKTRHNAGFWFVDALASKYSASFSTQTKFFGDLAQARIAMRNVRLLKPSTFMNHSGRSVSAIAAYFNIEPGQILVVYDELDLPTGVVRLKKGGGHGGHNGLRDIVSAIGSKEVLRLRLGIGHPGNSKQVVDFVLQEPGSGEAAAINLAADKALAQIENVVDGKLEAAMKTLHTDPPIPEKQQASGE